MLFEDTLLEEFMLYQKILIKKLLEKDIVDLDQGSIVASIIKYSETLYCCDISYHE